MKSKIFRIIIGILFLGCFVSILNALSFDSRHSLVKLPENLKPTTTPLPVTKQIEKALPLGTINQDWRKYTNEKYHYSFEIPSSWKVKILRDNYDGNGWKDNTFLAEYTVNNKTYIFSHHIASNAGREIEGDLYNLGEIIVEGEIFTLRSWSKNGIAYLVRADVNDYDIYGTYELLIPPDNHEYYFTVFKQILNSFRKSL